MVGVGKVKGRPGSGFSLNLCLNPAPTVTWDPTRIMKVKIYMDPDPDPQHCFYTLYFATTAALAFDLKKRQFSAW